MAKKGRRNPGRELPSGAVANAPGFEHLATTYEPPDWEIRTELMTSPQVLQITPPKHGVLLDSSFGRTFIDRPDGHAISYSHGTPGAGDNGRAILYALLAKAGRHLSPCTIAEMTKRSTLMNAPSFHQRFKHLRRAFRESGEKIRGVNLGVHFLHSAPNPYGVWWDATSPFCVVEPVSAIYEAEAHPELCLVLFHLILWNWQVPGQFLGDLPL